MQPIDMRILIHETDDVYQAKSSGYLTSHHLAHFRKNPLLYHKRRLGLVPEEADKLSYQIGRAAHRLILEGRKSFEASYAIGGPVNPKTHEVYHKKTKAYAKWVEAQRKPVLTFDEAALIENLNASVKAHQAAARLLSAGAAEGVIRAKYRGMLCQMRLDWLNPERGIVDLKTTGGKAPLPPFMQTGDLTTFEVDARMYGYIYQLAFYRSVLAEIVHEYVPCHIIAVEKQEPFRCGVWLVGEDALAAAQKENEQAMDRLKLCEQTGVWPTGFEEVRTFGCL